MLKKKNPLIYYPSHKRRRTIGVIVHSLDSYLVTSALQGIERVSTACGYEVIITNSQENKKKEVENVRMLYDRCVDGVIASLSMETENLAHFSDFTDKGIPVVFFDRVGNTGISDNVVIDNSRCGYLAAEHMISQGCKRIGILTSCLSGNVYAQRYKGFREALDHYNIPFTEDLLILGDFEKGDGAEAARSIMQMRPMPDGLFITNDLTAALCMNALKEAGIRVPQDIAIVGFNNDPVGRLITPTLTTIDYSGLELGKTAAANLLDHLSGRRTKVQNQTAIVPSALIVRNSSIRKGQAAGVS